MITRKEAANEVLAETRDRMTIMYEHACLRRLCLYKWKSPLAEPKQCPKCKSYRYTTKGGVK